MSQSRSKESLKRGKTLTTIPYGSTLQAIGNGKAEHLT